MSLSSSVDLLKVYLAFRETYEEIERRHNRDPFFTEEDHARDILELCLVAGLTYNSVKAGVPLSELV